MAVADRGEVGVVNLGYVAKTRPCLTLSIRVMDTDRALTTIIPSTSKARGTRFEANISTPFLIGGVFDARNPATTTHSKFVKKLGKLSLDEMSQVEDAVRLWLGL